MKEPIRMNIKAWVFLLFLLLPEILAAQSIVRADDLFDRGAYYEARETYCRLLAEFPEREQQSHIEFRTGVCCLRMNDYTGAREWLTKAEATGYTGEKLYRELGEVYLTTGNYRKAKGYFERYLKLVPDDPRMAAKLASCEWGMKMPPPDGQIQIEPLPYINTRGSEYGISWVRGGIIYSSTGDLLPEKRSEVSQRTGMGYSKPYLSFLRDGEYQAGLLLEGISRSSANEGSFSFDPVSENLYFARCEEQQENCCLIIARLNNHKCRQTGVLKIGQKGCNIAHPFVTDNGARLYFSSTMTGGYGGADIWYIEKDVWGKWGDPQNVGPEVNTPGNDIFPYVHGGRFFFASDGRVGYGGLDIYESQITAAGFGPSKNLGAPINTSYDDFNLILNDDERGGLLVSNRTAGRSDDIFRFEWKSVPEIAGVERKKAEEENVPKEERKEEIVLKGIQGGEELYRLGVESGVVKQKGWWVQVAMLMKSEIIDYASTVRVTQISGKQVVMYRGEDGGHRFYIGVYPEEQEARAVVKALKDAGIDCFIKNVTE